MPFALCALPRPRPTAWNTLCPACPKSFRCRLNAFRHARATKIEVEIDYAPSHLRILVRDNGCGMESGLLRVGREGHWGLTGMRERAEKIGAKLEVLSRANAGTEVLLSVVGAVTFQDASTGRSWNWLTRLYPQRLSKNVKEPGEEQHK